MATATKISSSYSLSEGGVSVSVLWNVNIATIDFSITTKIFVPLGTANPKTRVLNIGIAQRNKLLEIGAAFESALSSYQNKEVAMQMLLKYAHVLAHGSDDDADVV